MYWQHRTDYDKQIIVSRYKFSQAKTSHISFALEDLSLETCPIPINEFEEFTGIPSGIASKGINGIKEFFVSKEALYICFIGISQKAM